MTTSDQAKAQSFQMPVWKALLLFLPILLISLVLWLSNILSAGDPLLNIAAVLTWLAFNTLFVLMLITGKTHRYRSVLFILVAIALPLDFIPWMIQTYGSMMLTEELSPLPRLVSGR